MSRIEIEETRMLKPHFKVVFDPDRNWDWNERDWKEFVKLVETTIDAHKTKQVKGS